MTREEAVEILEEVKTIDDSMFAYSQAYNDAMNMAIEALKAQEPITGETSDGYHTFNELYYHRAVLFSVIVANYPERAWKSKKHHDGTMYDGMFIVGIDTPDGQAAYHYDVDPYWDMFKCRVLDNAPEWDGHTPSEAIERIGKLKAHEPVKPRIVDTSNSKLYHNDMFKNYYCGNCGEFLHAVNRKDLFCSQCGKAVKWE